VLAIEAVRGVPAVDAAGAPRNLENVDALAWSYGISRHGMSKRPPIVARRYGGD
jgi:hypothetical protein